LNALNARELTFMAAAAFELFTNNVPEFLVFSTTSPSAAIAKPLRKLAALVGPRGA
jgi:hypothetical protein